MSLCRYKFVAVFLMAFWLLATQHCGLEAAGVLESHAAAADEACCPSSEEPCAHDSCDTVENGSYRIDSSPVSVDTPQFVECFCLICLHLSTPPLREGSSIDEPPDICFQRPLDWVPVWHFVQRAAPSPRAPSLVLA